ncbi:BatD family protein [bacterium]|nr:BatD family protein [bacterium]
MIAVLLFIAMLFAPLAEAAELTATVDRTALSLGETVNYTVTFDGAATGVPTPVMPEMSHFEIESGPYMETKFEIVNRRRSSRASYTYVLRANRPGSCTIGSSYIDYKGKRYATDPIAMKIASATDARAGGRSTEMDDVFIRVITDKHEAYPGEQIVLTYKIFFAVQITSPEIIHPRATGFWTEEFEMPRQMSLRDEVVNGRSYKSGVFWKVAVFPTTSGDLTIQPMKIKTKVESRQDRRSFTSDPFFRLSRSMQTREIASPPVTLKIKPLPEQTQPETFGGAVGRFTIRANLDKTECDTHDAVTLTVLLRGVGNIKTLPEPIIQFPQDFEYYEPKSEENIVRNRANIEGTKKFEYVLIPRVSGPQVIPAIQYSYFDPETGDYVTASTQAMLLQVKHPKAANAGEVPLPFGRKRGVESIASDIAFAKTHPGVFYTTSVQPQATVVFWIYTVGPWLALAGLAVVRRRSSRFETGRMSIRRAVALAMKELNAAQKSASENRAEDANRMTVHAIRVCLGAVLNQDPGSLTSESITALWQEQKLDEAFKERILTLLDECDRSRFTAGLLEAADASRLVSEGREIVSLFESISGGGSA